MLFSTAVHAVFDSLFSKSYLPRSFESQIQVPDGVASDFIRTGQLLSDQLHYLIALQNLKRLLLSSPVIGFQPRPVTVRHSARRLHPV
jgi:hypothetical protein